MKIGSYDIKPILLYLPDEDIWQKEFEEAKVYLASQGIDDIYFLSGVHAVKWGIQGRHIYLIDGKPEEQYYIGDKKVGGFISQYIEFIVMDAMDHSHYMLMEGDCRFIEGWRERLETEMQNVPEDFDVLFVGSCCTENKEPVHIKGDVYEFPYRGEEKWDWYPQCSHCLIVAKKAAKHLINTNRDTANPADVSVMRYSFPELKVYAILPRLADQGEKTFLSI